MDVRIPGTNVTEQLNLWVFKEDICLNCLLEKEKHIQKSLYAQKW